ncbi:glycosyltransferase family 2 protein [Thalassotalea euphylliae]|uniref:Glycosyltransferase n=1 Tax=Thalassotalea euphylliae TaxID=1655234 RepID=A0A3E0UAU8_9GAMM|nr:glycosyltransferase [Thalassotalea euphylliae]REL33980.1 glycosyltransferase [Thalassotalea euphylliae]
MPTLNDQYEVSIIMPVYNTGKVMLKTVESIEQQISYKNHPVPSFEVILIDDGSDDVETLDILKSVRNKLNFKVVRNTSYKGASGARNFGISLAQSEWIVFLDSDDLLMPTALACSYKYICEDKGISWLASAINIFEDGKSIIPRPLKDSSPVLYKLIGKYFDCGKRAVLVNPTIELLETCFVSTLNVWIRRSLLKGLNTFDRRLRRAEDYKLWLELSLTTDLHFIPHYLGAYRQRSNSLTSGQQPMFSCEDIMLVQLLQDKKFKIYRSAILKRLMFVLVDQCYFYRKYGAYRQAVLASSRLIRKFPCQLVGWKMLFMSAIGK